MTVRQIAGWALLSLLPLTLVAMAAIAHQLPELAVGAGIAGVLCGAASLGIHLIDSGRRRR
ncbi:hypothetical protein ACFXAW_07135 [Streptomyces sp. NPDC059445]|uniref:hypothetical protein n=1 Tax=Streptomyces sp. NPDC059445 TaxID=3346832 RepID=UPI0036ADA9CF